MNRDIDNKFAGSYLLGAVDFFLRFIYYFFKSPFKYKQEIKKEGAILVYGESVNNRNTLLPILEELGTENVIDLHSHRQYPKWRMYWYAIPHLRELIGEVRNATPEKKEIIKRFFAKFWMMYGCHKEAGELLDYYRPRIVVMANDHLPFHRSLMHEANARTIPTMYVQHAAVTEEFPPLGFSYSLLDGEDSYRKYKQLKETKGKIYLCGGIRFDAIRDVVQQKPETTVIGVAINLMDDENLVKETCLAIKNKINESSIILRPHPQMQLDIWKRWCEENHIGFSFAKEETSFCFLSRISLLVSNQSSIHLDAAMCHTPSIVYGFSKKEIDDSYAFVKNGLCKRAESINDLFNFLLDDHKYIINEKAVKYYNSSYGSVYNGFVAKMMANMIKHISEGTVNIFNEKYGFVKKDTSGLREVYMAE